MLSAKEKIMNLRKEIASLYPQLLRERYTERLVQIESAIENHDKHGWPLAERDYYERMMYERSKLSFILKYGNYNK